MTHAKAVHSGRKIKLMFISYLLDFDEALKFKIWFKQCCQKLRGEFKLIMLESVSKKEKKVCIVSFFWISLKYSY